MTTLNRQNPIAAPTSVRKKTVFAIFVLLQTVFFIFPPHLQAAVQQNDPALISISWQRVEKILANRKFASGDELFQLLYILYNEEKDTSFRLDDDALSQLKKRSPPSFPSPVASPSKHGPPRLFSTSLKISRWPSPIPGDRPL